MQQYRPRADYNKHTIFSQGNHSDQNEYRDQNQDWVKVMLNMFSGVRHCQSGMVNYDDEL